MIARAAALQPVDLGGRRRCALLAAAALGLPWAWSGCTMGQASLDGPAPADYGSAMRQALRAVTGDLPNYRFRDSPVGQFGVGSLYLDELAGGDVKQAEGNWYLGGPEHWLLPAAAPAERQRWLSRLVAEGSLGAFRADTGAQRDLQAQVAAGLLQQLFGAQVGLQARRDMVARIEASEVRQRRLNWAEFDAALRAGRVAPEVAEVVRSGRFVVAAADIVLSGYRAEIGIDESRQPQLAAQLPAKALPPAALRAGLRISESARGRLAVASSQPVVAAVLLKRPPMVPKGAALPRVEDWPDAPVSERSLGEVERGALERPPR